MAIAAMKFSVIYAGEVSQLLVVVY